MASGVACMDESTKERPETQDDMTLVKYRSQQRLCEMVVRWKDANDS